MTADFPAQVYRFRGEYGRMCSLAAAALHEGSSVEAVRVAMSGEGESVKLAPLRRQRTIVNAWGTQAAVRLRGTGSTPTQATETLIAQARIARLAVESEWGHDRDNTPGSMWDSLALPMVKVVS